MPTYTFRLPASFASAPVSVFNTADVLQSSGTTDANATFAVALPTGDYYARVSYGYTSYRAAGEVDRGDLDNISEAAYGRTFQPSGDTSGASDTAALQALINALPAAGGEISLRAGAVYLNAPLTINKPLTLRGAGGMFRHDGGTWPGQAATTIYVNSATSDGLVVSAPGCVFVDFAVVNTSSTDPTAGAGIRQTNGYHFKWSRLTVAGFYDCARVEGWFYSIDSCNFYDPMHYGLYMGTTNSALYDHGDMAVSNCMFSMTHRTTDAQSAVRWEAGGGVRWSNNKVVGQQNIGTPTAGGFNYGLDFAVADGASTVELEVLGGNVSSCKVAAINLSQAGPSNTGVFRRVTINGLVSQGFGASSTGILVSAADYAHKNYISDVMIDNCVLAAFDTGILVKHATNVQIGANRHSAVTKPIVLGDSAVANQSPASVRVEKQITGHNTTANTIADNFDIITDYRAYGGDYAYAETTDYSYERSIRISAVTTPVSCFTVELPLAQAAAIEVSVTGWNINAGFNTANRKAVTKRERRALASPDGGAGGTVTVTTLGTDESVGNGAPFVAVLYDTTVANKVTVKVQTTDATQCSFEGIVAIKAPGAKFKTFRKGV